MSKRRPSHRDRLERDYISLVRERAEVAGEYDRRLLVMQRQLEAVESPRLGEGQVEHGGRKDALDKVPEARLAVLPDIEEGPEPSDFSPPATDWKAHALRMTALLVGVISMGTRDDEAQPKLFLRIVQLAAGLPGAVSMRQVAQVYGYSAERISQRVEDVQKRFNLPKNQHNKSAEAVAAYRVNAGLIKQPNTAA
jgi:hypothetical protein